MMLSTPKIFRIVFLLFIVCVFNGEVFSQENAKCFIKKIEYDKHNKTRRSTILREIEFAESDTLLVRNVPTLIEEAQKNLMNTLLFNFVTVEPIWNIDSTQLIVKIAVIEKWYVWPIPLLEIADLNFNSWWKDKDFSRLNYGMFLRWDNFTGRKDMLKVLLRFGNEDKLGLYYELPSFNKKQNFGVDIGISYAQKHEIAVESIDNELIYFRDDDVYVKESFSSFIRLTYRPKIHHKQHITVEYQDISIVDTLIPLYPSLTLNNLSKLKFLSLSYKYIVDYRDFILYPLSGYYFDIELTKMGLGMVQENGTDFLFIKSKFNYYWKLKGHWFYGAGLLTKFSNAKYQPYVLQRGLGYFNDFVRGYELYIMDGQHYGLFRSNLKYELLPKRIHNFKFIKNEKFSKVYYAIYLNLFFDLGYVKDRYNAILNPLVNEFQYGYGIGLDYVTYYDMIFRIEYSINRQNEKFLFFHVKAPF